MSNRIGSLTLLEEVPSRIENNIDDEIKLYQSWIEDLGKSIDNSIETVNQAQTTSYKAWSEEAEEKIAAWSSMRDPRLNDSDLRNSELADLARAARQEPDNMLRKIKDREYAKQKEYSEKIRDYQNKIRVLEEVKKALSWEEIDYTALRQRVLHALADELQYSYKDLLRLIADNKVQFTIEDSQNHDSEPYLKALTVVLTIGNEATVLFKGYAGMLQTKQFINKVELGNQNDGNINTHMKIRIDPDITIPERIKSLSDWQKSKITSRLRK